MARLTDHPKNRTITFRATEEFVNEMDNLANAFGMNRTELIEYLVEYIPNLTSQRDD